MSSDSLKVCPRPKVKYISTIFWSNKQQRTWGELAAPKDELSVSVWLQEGWKRMQGEQDQNFPLNLCKGENDSGIQYNLGLRL